MNQEDYRTHLQRLRHSPRTIKSYIKHLEKLEQWCRPKRIDPDTIKYKELMQIRIGIENDQRPRFREQPTGGHTPLF